MAKKKFALGRGLGDILGDMNQVYRKGVDSFEARVLELDLSLIKMNPSQPRKVFDQDSLLELSRSIKDHGLLQPILVIEGDSNDYVLVSGERRLRACKMAGFDHIKAIILNMGDYNLRELALIENIQRKDLGPIELANCYKKLIEEHGFTHDELARRVQKSRSHITNALRILELSENTIKHVESGVLTSGHAKVLVGLNTEDEAMATRSIVGMKLNVKDTEDLVRSIKKGKSSSSRSGGIIDRNMLYRLRDSLRGFGISVSVKEDGLVLNFKSAESAESLMQKISD